MASLYLIAAFMASVMAAIGAAFHLGKSSNEADNVERELDRAKIAKDVRSGDSLDNEWLRFRD